MGCKMFLFVLIGFLGGLLGGMGMGGGTILIPMLTWFLGFEQKVAQLINLLSFVIMAFFALIVHFKNKLVNLRVGLITAVGGIVTAVIFSLFVKKIEEKILKILFAVFLIILGLFQLFFYIKKQKQKNTRL